MTYSLIQYAQDNAHELVAVTKQSEKVHYSYTVEPPIMNSPNNEKPLIMKMYIPFAYTSIDLYLSIKKTSK